MACSVACLCSCLSAIPCVGIIMDKINNWIVDEIVKRFKYMFCHKGLLRELDSKIEELKVEQKKMVEKAEDERSNGKLLKDDVVNWQNNVGNIQESATDVLRRYENRLSLNCIPCLPISKPFSDYRLGEEAAKKVESINKLTSTGRNFLASEIACFPSPNVETIDFLDFQSRKVAYENLWEQLVSKDSSPILGIYGLPGVGKTRLMEHISEKAEKKKIFKKVARANVGSEELDLINLQKQIADVLNCDFGSDDNVSRRASQLKASIKHTGKMLIVFDDVWEDIPLNTIGIPCADECSSMNCKILFTSREKNVCLGNNCTHPVMVSPLTVVESWVLFRNTVGTKIIDSLQNEFLTKEVCNECGGLPLVINAVGGALKFMSKNVWEEALEQLRQSKIENVPRINLKVYACLKLSFDKLPEQEKACLLLCSIFPEDADIPIRKLIILATGWQPGSHLARKGKLRVRAIVDILKPSSLLLGSSDDEHFKLHDTIRDVARSIADADPNYAFLFERCDSRFPYKNDDNSARKLIHLELERNDLLFPPKLRYPDVHTLSLLSAVSASASNWDFTFKGWDLNSIFVNLRFLMLNNFTVEEQFCLQPLGQLETLFLDHCNISNSDVSFFPENLETLCMWDCFQPVPLVLPNLKYLRKLEILVKKSKWEIPAISSKSRNPWGHSKMEPLGLPNFHHLQKQEIRGGQSNLLFLHEHEILAGESKMKPLVLPNLDNLRQLEIVEDEGGYMSIPYTQEVVRSTLTRVVFAVNTISSLSSLKELHIPTGFIISNSARDLGEHYSISGEMSELTSLKSLQMLFREPLELTNIFSDLDEFNIRVGEPTGYVSSLQDSIVSFKRSVEFSGSRFEAFQSLMERAEELSLAKTSVELSKILASNGEAFADLRYLYIGECHAMDHLASIPLNEIQDSLQSLTPFSKLTVLKINSCFKMKYTFCNNVAKGLIQLQELSVVHCHRMKVIVMNEGTSDGDFVNFSRLKSLELSYLWELKSFNGEKKNARSSSTSLINNSASPSFQSHPLFDGMVAFRQLVMLKIHNFGCCTLFGFSAFESLQQLQELEISGCASLEKIVEDVKGDEPFGMDKKTVRLVQLRSVILIDLPNLKSFIHGANYEFHMPALERIKVDNCGLSTLFTCSIFKSLQNLKELSVHKCNLLEGIVDDASGAESSNMNVKKITLFQLSAIILENLPSLRSFSSTTSYAFDMPRLHFVRLLRCYEVDKFTSLKTKTGMVTVDAGFHEELVPDLNDFIRQRRENGLSGSFGVWDYSDYSFY